MNFHRFLKPRSERPSELLSIKKFGELASKVTDLTWASSNPLLYPPVMPDTEGLAKAAEMARRLSHQHREASRDLAIERHKKSGRVPELTRRLQALKQMLDDMRVPNEHAVFQTAKVQGALRRLELASNVQNKDSQPTVRLLREVMTAACANQLRMMKKNALTPDKLLRPPSIEHVIAQFEIKSRTKLRNVAYGCEWNELSYQKLQPGVFQRPEIRQPLRRLDALRLQRWEAHVNPGKTSPSDADIRRAISEVTGALARLPYWTLMARPDPYLANVLKDEDGRVARVTPGRLKAAQDEIDKVTANFTDLAQSPRPPQRPGAGNGRSSFQNGGHGPRGRRAHSHP